jgi:hypothetical protein
MFKLGALIACAALALSACQTVPIRSSDIANACTIINVASVGFDAFAKAKPQAVSASALKWKAGAMAAVAPICANPEAIDALTDPTKYASALKTLKDTADALIDFVHDVGG